MKILWIDPVNTDAQFLNVMAFSLANSGVDVLVRSRKRLLFLPPDNIKWYEFGCIGSIGQSLSKGILRYITGVSYPFDWLKAIIWAIQYKPKKILISSYLQLVEIDVAALWILRNFGIKPIILCHKPHPDFFISHSVRKARRFRHFFLLAEKILVMNEYSQNLLSSYYNLSKKKLDIFPHPHFGEYLQKYSPDPLLMSQLTTWIKESPVIGIISNYKPESGFDYFLNSLYEIRNRLPEVKIIICTNTPFTPLKVRDELVNAAYQAGFDSSRAHIYVGSYSYEQLIAYIHCCSLIVCPYKWATQSGVIAIATGFGIPVVTTNVGGLPEMILPGLSGELVNPMDKISLATACEAIISNLDSYRAGALISAKKLLNPDISARKIIEVMLG